MSDQASNWQEVAKAVKILGAAIDKVPAPPVPNDQFGETLNGVKGNYRQLKDVTYEQANIELAKENQEEG